MEFEERESRLQAQQELPNKRRNIISNELMQGYSPATLPTIVPRRAPARIRLPIWMAVLILVGGIVLFFVGILQLGEILFSSAPAEVDETPAVFEKPVVDSGVVANALKIVRFQPNPTFATVAPQPIQQLAASWSQPISDWQDDILLAIEPYQFAPDLIAAIIDIESDGSPTGVSYAGAVGLMGIMPQGSGAGLDNRPMASQLTHPTLNLKWGTKILANYLHQANGDLGLALAVYNGGWGHAGSVATQTYALDVLHQTGYALATHVGVEDAAVIWGVEWEVCPCASERITVNDVEIAPIVLFDDGEMRLEGVPVVVVE